MSVPVLNMAATKCASTLPDHSSARASTAPISFCLMGKPALVCIYACNYVGTCRVNAI